MTLSKNQKKDLETILYFLPNQLKTIQITDKDKEMFFEYSERGLHKDKVKLSGFTDGFNVLLEGKRWRGIHMGMWEEGIMDGSVPYFTLLGGENKEEILPESVVDFMKKEMFKGRDKDIVGKIYKKI